MATKKFKYSVREEEFCRLVAEGIGQSDAYRQAGYAVEKMKTASIHRSAKFLMDKPKIISRLAELRAPIAAQHRVTVDSLMIELEQARMVALAAETPQASAAVAATMGKAKLCGLDKQVLDLRNSDGSLRPQPTVIRLVAPSDDT